MAYTLPLTLAVMRVGDYDKGGKMTREEFLSIFNVERDVLWKGCNVRQGLSILAKYLPRRCLSYTGQRIIYAVSVDEIVKAGITQEDAEKLSCLNWMIDENYLKCFG